MKIKNLTTMAILFCAFWIPNGFSDNVKSEEAVEENFIGKLIEEPMNPQVPEMIIPEPKEQVEEKDLVKIPAEPKEEPLPFQNIENVVQPPIPEVIPSSYERIESPSPRFAGFAGGAVIFTGGTVEVTETFVPDPKPTTPSVPVPNPTELAVEKITETIQPELPLPNLEAIYSDIPLPPTAGENEDTVAPSADSAIDSALGLS